jgi:hypothetical protein
MEKSLSFFGKERENKKKWRKNIPDLEKLKIKQFQNENREKMIQKKKKKRDCKGDAHGAGPFNSCWFYSLYPKKQIRLAD